MGQTKQQVKGRDQEAQSLNNYLKAIKAKLYQKEAELLEEALSITAQLLYDAYFDIKWNPLKKEACLKSLKNITKNKRKSWLAMEFLKLLIGCLSIPSDY